MSFLVSFLLFQYIPQGNEKLIEHLNFNCDDGGFKMMRCRGSTFINIQLPKVTWRIFAKQNLKTSEISNELKFNISRAL